MNHLLRGMLLLLGTAVSVRSFRPSFRSIHREGRRTAWGTSLNPKGNPQAPQNQQRVTKLWSSSSIEWTTEKVRSTFIDYFVQTHHHVYQPSSACAPLNDPTLLFTNAGMNQFKPIFLGQVDPQSNMATLKRAVNSQKCIRAGGKHNDLDDVGRDTYHHTFFEMLGSWSFGDYFKKEAIDFAWTLLTDVYGLDASRLYATYFEGDDAVPADTEARDYWLQYLPTERVLPCSARDNFWEMGETGPCGPCTEIHYDRIGQGRDASLLVNADDPNVIEIWNLVFIQYNRDVSGLQPLPAQHVDTGMGLERLVSILQDKTSNYDIDCFQPIFTKLATLATVGRPYAGRIGADDDDLVDTAYRAIADHVRTLSFAIADGAVPNNEGRGYVLRRILRRAARYGQQILGIPPSSGFLAQLIPVVVETFGPTYPELVTARDRIVELVREEEEAFGTMLDRGIKFFTELKDDMVSKQQRELPGDQAFFLYDTLGFPIDLTEQMALEAGLTVDTTAFTRAMEEQKQRSRTAQRAARGEASGGIVLELIAEQTAALDTMNVQPTDDGFKYKWDVSLPATVMAIFTSNGFLDESTAAVENDYVGLVLDKSSFYAEGGGQETDTGRIEMISPDGIVTGVFTVTDVQVYGGFILHKGIVEEGEISVGTHVNCAVDYDRRQRIAPNHSMTHVLNAALRQVLGDGVDQRGSLCNEDKLRFDFSHKRALTLAEVKQVEELCQAVVAQGQVVHSEMMALEDAKQIDGVRAVFGEIYPDPVRVIRIGDDTSIEFCGGTHVTNTNEAQAFCLVEETAVAKGIRRITAVTKDAAIDALSSGARFVELVNALEQCDPNVTSDLDKQAGATRKDLDAAFVSAAVKAELRNRIEVVSKKASDAAKKALQQRVDMCLVSVRQALADAVAAQQSFIVLNVDIGADTKASQTVLNVIKEVAPTMAFLGVSEEVPGSGGKVLTFCYVPNDDKALQPDEWVLAAMESCQGRGGGRSGTAQAQAVSCIDVSVLYDAAKDFANAKLSAKVA